MALEYDGTDVTVENNLFEENDWSGNNMNEAMGGRKIKQSYNVGELRIYAETRIHRIFQRLTRFYHRIYPLDSRTCSLFDTQRMHSEGNTPCAISTFLKLINNSSRENKENHYSR